MMVKPDLDDEPVEHLKLGEAEIADREPNSVTESGPGSPSAARPRRPQRRRREGKVNGAMANICVSGGCYRQ
jgi:hypothetical protein